MCCLSGFNTTVTFRSHEGSLPGLPDLGRALSGIEMDFVIPNFGLPRDGDGDSPGGDDHDRSPHFIKDATVITPP